MADPTDVVGVLRGHLEEIHTALDWFRGLTTSLDLMDGYRQGKVTMRPSRASQMADKAIERCEMYLRTDEETDGGQS